VSNIRDMLEIAGRGNSPGQDIRDQLRRDHENALLDLDALREETNDQRCRAVLRRLRRGWVIHALAEETVVYRALEGVEAGGTRADERFIEHELVEGLFDKLGRCRAGSLEWRARINVARSLIVRHIETEHDEMFAELSRRFDAAALDEMGRRFQLAREKLTLLEDAKAA
jgi:hemerythrin HHE cation binding domain-containing protein